MRKGGLLLLESDSPAERDTNCILRRSVAARNGFYSMTDHWSLLQEKLYLEGPFSENSETEGVGRQRRSHPGRKQLRKDQLHSLPELIRAA